MMNGLLRLLKSLGTLFASTRFLHVLGTVLVVGVFSWAVYLLYYELSHVNDRVEAEVQSQMGAGQASPDQVKRNIEHLWRDIRSTSPRALALAIGLTVLSYIILVGYDMLAMAFVNQKLPLWKIAMVAFVGYSFSYNFGATMAGAPTRFRLYAGWKVPMGRIVELLVILGLTFWFGLFFLGGILFTISGIRIPADVLAKLQEGVVASFVARHMQAHFHMVGLTLLGVSLLYLAASAAFKGQIRLFGKAIPVPAFRLTVYQYAIASADFIVAGSVLFVLLPQQDHVTYTYVLAVYILAYVAEVLTHVPGGWGIFDYLICKLLPGHFLANFAAVLLFRIIYRIVPVLIAAVLFGANEIMLRRESISSLGHMLAHPATPDGEGSPAATHEPPAPRSECCADL